MPGSTLRAGGAGRDGAAGPAGLRPASSGQALTGRAVRVGAKKHDGRRPGRGWPAARASAQARRYWPSAMARLTARPRSHGRRRGPRSRARGLSAAACSSAASGLLRMATSASWSVTPAHAIRSSGRPWPPIPCSRARGGRSEEAEHAHRRRHRPTHRVPQPASPSPGAVRDEAGRHGRIGQRGDDVLAARSGSTALVAISAARRRQHPPCCTRCFSRLSRKPGDLRSPSACWIWFIEPQLSARRSGWGDHQVPSPPICFSHRAVPGAVNQACGRHR